MAIPQTVTEMARFAKAITINGFSVIDPLRNVL